MGDVGEPFLVPVDATLRAQLAASARPGPTGLSASAAVRFTTALLLTPYGRTHLRHVALVEPDGRVLASAVLERRHALMGDGPVEACVVCDLTPHEASDAVDTSARLLVRLVSQAREFAADAAVIVADVALSETPAGFTTQALDDLTLVVREDARRGAPMAPVRSGQPDDVTWIGEFAPLEAVPHGLRFPRDPAAFAFTLTRHRLLSGLAPAGQRESWFLVVEEGMRAAAYVVLSVTPGHWVVDDWGDRDPTGARVGAILQTLIAREPAERRPHITTRLPAASVPPQVTVDDLLVSPVARHTYALTPARP